MKRPADLFEIIAPTGPAVRLDLFLARNVPGGTRHHARDLIERGMARINGHRARKGDPVRSGDLVTIEAPASDRETKPTREVGLAIPVLYEDADVVAVDKPANIPSVSLRPGDRRTVADFLLGRYPEMREVGGRPGEAGLVHRLDTGTSGVLLAARTTAAHAALRAQFSHRTAEKTYLAIVAGAVDASGSIATPIAHAPRRPRRMQICDTPASAQRQKARPARTRYRRLEQFADATLVTVNITTGVRHQIRVHLASIGHPVIGDPLYGRSDGPVPAARPMLHAQRLRFRHPQTDAPIVIEAPLPEDFRALLDRLRAT